MSEDKILKKLLISLNPIVHEMSGGAPMTFNEYRIYLTAALVHVYRTRYGLPIRTIIKTLEGVANNEQMVG